MRLDAKLEFTEAVGRDQAGFDSPGGVVAQSALSRVATVRIYRPPFPACSHESRATLAVHRVARLPVPVPCEVRAVEVGGQYRAAAQFDVVGGRKAKTLGVEVVVLERVVAATKVAELGFRKAGVGDLRVFLVIVGTQRDGLAVADLADPFQVEVVHRVLVVLASAFTLLVGEVEQEAASAQAHLAVEVIAIAGRALHVTAQSL